MVACGCSSCQFYDSDKLFPVVGFGGSPQQGAPVSHCFPMTDDGSYGPCRGIGGVLQAYANTLRTVSLSGPTLFTQIVTQAAQTASSAAVSQGNQKYFILLIITDGKVLLPCAPCPCIRDATSC